MKDEIMAELWQIKDELAREANYDVHLLCRELREIQASSPVQVVDRSTPYPSNAKTCTLTTPSCCPNHKQNRSSDSLPPPKGG
jgi:hypothetical protein